MGTAPELAEYFGELAGHGVERVYAWFADFGVTETLVAFGEQVISHFDPISRPT